MSAPQEPAPRPPRQSLTGQTLLLSSGKLLASVSTVAITAVLTRQLSLSEYATHKQALLIYAVCAPFLTLGLPAALLVFLPRAAHRPRGVLLENLSLLGGLGALFAAGLLLGGVGPFAARFDNPALLGVVAPLALYALCFPPTSSFSACMMGLGRPKSVVVFQVGSQVALLVGVTVVASLFHSARATLWLYAVWAALSLSFALRHMLAATAPGAPNLIAGASAARVEGGSSVRWAGLRAQLAYGIPLGLAGMFGTLSNQIDKYMVSEMGGPEAFAVYVTGALEIPLVGVITGSMNAVILPHLAAHYAAGRMEAIRDLWQRAMNKALILLAPVMCVAWLLSGELMATLFSERYRGAAAPFRVYALVLPLRAAVYGGVLMAAGRTRWVTLSALIGLALNAALNFFFIRAYGPVGAAWATALSTYLVIAVMVWMIGRTLALPVRSLFDWSHIGRTLLGAVAPAALVWAVDPLEGASDVLRGVALGGAYGLLTVGAYAALGVAHPRAIMGLLRRR